MPEFTQEGRVFHITTPLGDDVLLLTSFNGREAMSEPFLFNLDLVSENLAIAPADIVSKPVTWTVFPDSEKPRVFNGIVAKWQAGAISGRGFRSYRADVVPWLWFLGLSVDSRIHQEKNVQDIVTDWFDELGFSDYEFNASPAPEPRVYCVQYQESTLNFISRLLEEEGIYYFVKHEDGKHTVTLSNQKGDYWDLPETPASISSWEHLYEMKSGKWTFTDYNFETPATSLLSNTDTILKIPGMSKFERFEYPGGYLTKSIGDAWAKIRMEEEEAAYETVAGSSQTTALAPGGKFTYDGHDSSDENKPYVLTSVEHSATDESVGGGGGRGQYSNKFTCIPADVLFRPPRKSPWPMIYGPQTAIVTGTQGEEQMVDKYGRIKVQFFWDRKGKKDDKTSCWIRVSQPIAGKNWGAQYIPRIGQEVVVNFLDGNPDRPLVTGSVYHAQNMPPYALPDNMTKSGYLGRSTKEGEATSNEFVIEDKKDAEDIFFYAKKDWHRKVEHDDDLKVLNNQTITITKDRGVTITEGHETHEVSKGKMETKIGEGDWKLDVSKGNHDTKVGMGNSKLTVSMGNLTQKVELGKTESEAMQSIEFKVGSNSVKIDQTGVTIKGIMVTIEGQATAEMKSGAMTTVKSDALCKLSGGVIMIG